MSVSWHTMVDFDPPQVAYVDANHSFAALGATGECAIAIPARCLASTVVKVGNSSGRDIDKFAVFGLTATSATRVPPPLIRECFVNLEC